MLSVAPSSPPPPARVLPLPLHPHGHGHSTRPLPVPVPLSAPVQLPTPGPTPSSTPTPTPAAVPASIQAAVQQATTVHSRSDTSTLAHTSAPALVRHVSAESQAQITMQHGAVVDGNAPGVQAAPKLPAVEVDPIDRILATQLAHLASQHHSSEYSRSKIFHRQAPNVLSYIPVSLQNPAFVQCLRQRQAELAEKPAWCLSDRQPSSSNPHPAAQQGEITEVPVFQERAGVVVASDVQTEIKAAIEEQLPPAPGHGTKTSASHPIHISSIVPMSSMPLITRFLDRQASHSPYIFSLPDHWRLHRVILSPPQYPAQHSGAGIVVPQPSNWPKLPVMWSQPGSNELLQNALNTDLALKLGRSPASQTSQIPQHGPHASQISLPQYAKTLVPPPTPPSQPRTPRPPSPHKRTYRRQTRRDATQKRSSSAPPALYAQKGLRRPASFKELRPGNSTAGLARAKSHPDVPKADLTPAALFVSSSFGIPLRTDVKGSQDSHEDAPPKLAGAQSNICTPERSMTEDTEPAPPGVNPRAASSKPPLHRLGNFFLSSCPGKKVRLQGPVKGRGTICRDVRADLARVRDLGVKCVICCLDDTELEFLGASWPEYWSVAKDLGLDILRIPLPEGLAPLSPSFLDSHLTRVLEEYTLKGVPVLAHCRGGVGRAGLVACCWMLKLGLCGWRDEVLCQRVCAKDCRDRSRASALGQKPTPKADGLMPAPRVCRATLQLVENVVGVLRQRRSLKAIETYEQVRFLVEFVEYLEHASLLRSSAATEVCSLL